MAAHLFAGAACDYYRITDGLPQYPDGEHDVAIPDS